MKAIIQHRYGAPTDVLALGTIDTPPIGDDEVLVCVRAASVHPDVWHVVTGLPRVLRIMGSGLREPRHGVPGTDMAGVVEAVGKDVTRFQPGDEVFGETIRGQQWKNGGAYAEFVAAPEIALARKPAGVSFEQAASVPTSGLIALANLPKDKTLPGCQVLVNGAGGGVGTIALQVAKARGAGVTAVDRTDKQEMLRSLGADHVIDYTAEDFTRGDERYDLIFDVPGNHSFAKCRRALKPDGLYILIGHDQYGHGMRRWLGSMPRLLKLVAMSPFVDQLPSINLSGPDKQESMEELRQLLDDGSITPIIDRTWPLAGAAEAIAWLASGKAHGKVVITVDHDQNGSS